MGADRITDMLWRVGFAVSLALAGLLLGAAGCAPLVDMPPPSLDGPRISNIRFNPQEGRVGCRFDIVVQVDTVHGTPTQIELPTDLVVSVSLTSSTGRDCEPTLDHLRLLGTSAGACIRGPSVASLEP